MEIEHISKCILCNSDKLYNIDKNNNMCKCKSCTFIFNNPRPSYDTIKDFYSKNDKYDHWLKVEKGRNNLWLRRLKLIRKHKKTGSLLDIGTGIGQFLHYAKKYYSVEGTEISESAIKIAKERYNVNLKKGQINDIDLKNNTFDIITLFHVLEHVPNPLEVIKICKSLLNKNGMIVIAVPNEIDSFQAYIKRFLARLPISNFKKFGRTAIRKIQLDGSLEEIHLSHFTMSTLKNALETIGYTIKEVSLDPYFTLSGPKKLIYYMYYKLLTYVNKCFKMNFYTTIWMIAVVNADD